MKNIVQFTSKEPPVVELDSAACAAYVRFSKKKIHRTEIVHSGHVEVTLDIDASGNPVGIELIGVKEFTIKALMAASGLKVPRNRLREMTKETRYVPTGGLATA